ncbi:MAG TPA: PfkB family carbohydrate kinase, partial [Nitrolancea sp.]|nr:PfkB family carbohydrate kinase [Nitrolancea sp.]
MSDSRVLAVDSKKLARFREAGATIITPNHLEAQLAAGISDGDPAADDISSTIRIGRRLIEAMDVEQVAITMGSEGVCLVDHHGRARYLPAHPVPHVSDVGAGDSFLAAVALSLATGTDARQSAQIAIEAACIAAGKRRTSVVYLQELLQRVSLNEHLAPARRPEQEIVSVIAEIDAARRSGKTIVFTNGIFDLLHAGHIEFLNRARELGDLLVVGVNSNRTTQLLKGSNRPINDERSRLALVRALAPVGHAILFDDEEPSALIRALQPDIHVKGGDYAGVDLPEAEAVAEVGGQIVILPLAGNQEARQMIERIAVLSSGDEIGDEL